MYKFTKEFELHLAHVRSLTMRLHHEINGHKTRMKPTAYIQLKRLLGISGSRKSVLVQAIEYLRNNDGTNTTPQI